MQPGTNGCLSLGAFQVNPWGDGPESREEQIKTLIESANQSILRADAEMKKVNTVNEPVKISPDPLPFDEWFIDGDGKAKRRHIITQEEAEAWDDNNPKYVGDRKAGEIITYITPAPALVHPNGSWVVVFSEDEEAKFLAEGYAYPATRLAPIEEAGRQVLESIRAYEESGGKLPE